MDNSISEQHFSAGYKSLLICGPALLVLIGLIPGFWLNRRPGLTAKLATLVATFNTIVAATTLAFLINGGESYFKLGGLAVYLDTLASMVYLLVSVLLLVVIRFSREYLAGDPHQGRYYKWLSLTGAAVLLLIISGNLLQFTLCWMAISLFLHQLLVFYRDRPGALLAARKKFIISRLGDLCLIGSLVLVFRDYGTWDIRSIFAQVAAAQDAQITTHASWTALLLVAGALLKSAQFPFHSWLPDTMETPTPVSALMHAGIINAGGFLIMRFSPLIADAALANQLLVIIGGFTALFGAFVMLTQASIKRALAFSTVSQMGFMMLECGLGAYGMALLHLMAHSFYKAYAFLRSGSSVENRFVELPKLRPLATDIGLAIVCLPVCALVFTGSAFLFAPPGMTAEGFVLASVIVTGMAFFLWNLWRQELTLHLVASGLLAVATLTGLYHILHAVFGQFVHRLPDAGGVIPWALAIILAGSFLGAYLLCVGLSLRISSSVLGKLYIHARNGFYINTLANRLVHHFWPVKL
jgi:NAD(P)H-quinone oxidoreductase subunit 5